MKTDSANYYLHKALSLIFGVLFLGGVIYGLLNPDNFTVTYNDEVSETNFVNLLPFTIIGSLATMLFI